MAPSPTRRRLLAGAGAVATGTLAGCTQRLLPGTGDGPQPVSLSIKTPPVADDPMAAMIASQLEENLRAAGVDAVREPMDKSELYRELLIDREFDLFVFRHPGLDDADAFRSMLHSRFVGEQGWQNPFGFSDPTVDDLLEEQLSNDGDDRREALSELLDYLVDTAPYTAVTFPDRLDAASDALERSTPPDRPTDFVDLLADRPSGEPFRVGTFGSSPTDRLNPLTVEASRIDHVLELLYDPLVRRSDDGTAPWLAESVSWDEPAVSGGRLAATVELRAGARWHDDEPLDSADVAFTYEFLGDTSLGDADGSVPSLRFRGRESLVDEVRVIDGRTLEFAFDGPSSAVAERALTVPILPEHVWRERSALVGDLWTEALDADNEAPIGSGLFSFHDADGDRLELEPFDEHVLRTNGDPTDDEPLPPLDGSLEFRISPGPAAAIEALLEGELELVSGRLTPDDLEPVESNPDVSVLSGHTRAFYAIGYNVQQSPLGNPNFRAIVSQLVDREHVVEDVFDGYARPVTTPSSLLGLTDVELEEASRSVIPTFPGSDGEIDEELVRSRFEDAGYRYEDGTLMV